MYDKFDVLICITSYNRYDKVNRMVNQLLMQETKYNYHILLINDASDDDRYDMFENYSDKLTYIYKIKNVGKSLYYQTINELWSLITNYESEFIIQTDDDFYLCDNFLNSLIDEFKNSRINDNKILALCPHLYSFNKVSNNEPTWFDNKKIDGIAIMTQNVLMNMDYQLKSPGNVSKSGVSVGIWQQISKSIMDLGGISKRGDYSMVYHDNIDGSVLHSDFRKHKMIYTQKFIGEVPNEIINFDKNYSVPIDIKKKNSGATSNGNQIPENTEQLRKTEAEISRKAISAKPKILPKIEQKSPTISVIPGDSVIGKMRKKNLGFGGRR